MEKKIKILVFLVGDIKYDARVSKEINSMLKLGYDVVFVQTENIENIDKFPCKAYVINKRRGYSIGKLMDMIKVQRRISKIIKLERPDYIHCNDFNTIVYSFPWIKKHKVVFDAHELARECFTGWFKTLYAFIETYLVKHFHAIILPQQDRLKYFSFLYPCTKKKLFLLENFPTKFNVSDEDFFKEYLNIDRGDNKLVLYTGRLNEERRVEELIRGFACVESLILVIIGFGSSEYINNLKKTISILGIQDKVYILEPIRHEDIKVAAASADIGVCFYDDPNLNSYFCASNKLYELMDSGTLVLTNDTVGATRVLGPENGFCIADITTEQIAEGLSFLSKSKPAPRMDYWWEKQESILLDIYV